MAEDHWYPVSDEDEEDALLNRAYDRWEQLGGAAPARGPLFQFTMQPIGRRRRWRNVVERAQFNAQLRQLRDAGPGDNIGMALTEALHHAIETELDREQRPAHHFVNFAITAHGFTHAYQTANFTVGEFLQRTARLDEMLATLAGKLNSNEACNPDRGFQVDVVFVSMPGPGSGRHKQRNVGRLCLDRDNKKKQCIVTIKNRDMLCCARAIVTMRAHCHKDQGVDEFRQWENLKKGYPVQQRQAQALHQQAGVVEGPCGLPELRQFQQALGPHYQLLVMTRMKPFFLIFKGPAAPHQIRLLKSNDHFDGCTSFPAFVNRSYYCVDCERGFNTNDRTHHTCQGKRCRACSRFDCLELCAWHSPHGVLPFMSPQVLWIPLQTSSCGQQTMSIDQNLSQVSSSIHRGSQPTSPVRTRQMPCVSGMGAHPGPQVLHSARGGKRGARTNRGGGRLHGGATPSPVCLRGF